MQGFRNKHEFHPMSTYHGKKKKKTLNKKCFSGTKIDALMIPSEI